MDQGVRQSERAPAGRIAVAARSLARWGRRHAGIGFGAAAGVALLAVVLAAAALIGAGDVREANDTGRVASEWRDAMLRLGINPVFPPTEDMHVGDIFAVDDGPANGSGAAQVLGHTMVIGHAAGTEAVLRRTYQAIPRFPPTPKDYDGVSPVEAAGPLFSPDPDVRSLPVVAFPGVTVSSARAASAGGLIPWLRGVLGFARSASESVQMRIPQAETYGIYAADAEALLEGFCEPKNAPSPNEVCTDGGVRLLLSSRNPAVLRTTGGRKPDHVSLQFIYRVYMTRSIDYVYGADTSVGAAARSGPRGSAEPAGSEAARQPLAEAGKTSRVSVESLTRDGVDLKVTLARPVVIGYAMLKTDPWPDAPGSAAGVAARTEAQK